MTERRVPLLVVALTAGVLSSCSGRLSGADQRTDAPTVLPPLDETPLVGAPSLIGAAAGSGSVRLDWSSGEDGTVLALYAGSSPEDVYSGAPLVSPLEGSSLVLDGLVDGQPLVFGLARLSDGEAVATPSGALLTVVPRPPIYVDVAASPAGADGLTPDTAYGDPLLALLDALVAGGGNVWIAGGDYGATTLPVFPGTHVAGGFAPGFALEERDPLAHATVLRGVPNAPLLRFEAGVEPIVLDGLRLFGEDAATVGVDATGPEAELRGLTVEACKGPGVRLGGTSSGDPLAYRLTNCASLGNGAEGLSLSGGVDLVARGCRFDGNVQEGLDADDLVANDGSTARLVLAECRAAGNGAEGIDIDLAANPGGGTSGGELLVRLENCTLSRNGAAGLLVDVDYEQHPLWSADVVLRGVTARANGSHGVHLDLDARAPAFVHRLLATGNRDDGLLLSTESAPGVVVVSSSACVGNGGVGLRTDEGNGVALVSHAVLAGNTGGGLRAELVAAAATGCVAWLQDAPYAQAVVRAGASGDDPFDPLLARLPARFLRVVALADGALGLAPGEAPLDPSVAHELEDDGELRRLVDVLPSGDVLLDPAPDFALLPALLASFVDDASVFEDWRVPPGSPAEGAGLAAPGSPAPDAGPLGASGGGVPGRDDLADRPLFRLRTVDPPLHAGVAADAELVLTFADGVPSAASVDGLSVVARDGDDLLLSAPAFVADGALHVLPPEGGWPAGATLALHPTLLSEDGSSLVGPLLLPLLPP